MPISRAPQAPPPPPCSCAAEEEALSSDAACRRLQAARERAVCAPGPCDAAAATPVPRAGVRRARGRSPNPSAAAVCSAPTAWVRSALPGLNPPTGTRRRGVGWGVWTRWGGRGGSEGGVDPSPGQQDTQTCLALKAPEFLFFCTTKAQTWLTLLVKKDHSAGEMQSSRFVAKSGSTLRRYQFTTVHFHGDTLFNVNS